MASEHPNMSKQCTAGKGKKTGNVQINVTLRCVCAPIVAVQKQ